MKIKSLILVFILITTVIIFAVAIGFVTYYTRNQSLEKSKQISDLKASEFANSIKADMEANLATTKTLAQTLVGFHEMNFAQAIGVYENILKNIYIDNKNFLTVRACWERNFVDPSYDLPYGRIEIQVREYSGQFIISIDTLDVNKIDKQSKYNTVKLQNREMVFNPYNLKYDSRMPEELVTSIYVPMVREGHFIGMASVDMSLKKYQEMVNLFRPEKEGSVFLIANDGSFISHYNKNIIGKKFSEINPEFSERNKIIERIADGEVFSIMEPRIGYTSFVPIFIGNSHSPWSVAIEVPVNLIFAETNKSFRTSVLIGLFGLVILTIIILLVSHRISSALMNIMQTLGILSVGDTRSAIKFQVKSVGNEIRQIKDSVNKLIDGFNGAVEFANQIGKGNLDFHYQLLGPKDALGNALIEMQKNLTKAKEDEVKRKNEDEKRNWAAHGLSQLNEILGQSRRNLDDFASKIISSLTKYVSANQGGLFVVNDDNPKDIHIELLACYAYDRKRMLKKRIEVGIGLIGRCFYEKKTLYLTEIPEEYIYITSGLGESRPNVLLIVPLVYNNEIFGVIELASFTEMEKYQLEFVEKFSENIATAISNIKINIKTEQLLEESNRKSQDLALHEREMQESIKELRITQEELIIREKELSGIFYAINSNSPVIHFDPFGNIIQINQSKALTEQLYDETMTGRNHREFAVESIENPEEYENFWNDLRIGKNKKRLLRIGNEDVSKYYFETYTPIIDDIGEVTKIICIQTDVTSFKLKELELLHKITEVDKL